MCDSCRDQAWLCKTSRALPSRSLGTLRPCGATAQVPCLAGSCRCSWRRGRRARSVCHSGGHSSAAWSTSRNRQEIVACATSWGSRRKDGKVLPSVYEENLWRRTPSRPGVCETLVKKRRQHSFEAFLKVNHSETTVLFLLISWISLASGSVVYLW